ncbi:hypothetical protein V2J09_008544 [Rumex salicifolius]
MEKESPPSLLTGRRMFLLINCIILGIGIAGGPLVMRLYYIHGGSRIWLQACLETAGFPVMLLPLAVAYINRRRRSGSAAPKLLITPTLAAWSAGVGLVAGVADYMYARGVGLIPVSTSSLILSTQMAFTAVFCYFLVKQRFTAFSVNAVVMLTLAASVLALHAGGDVGKKESRAEYFLGFFMTLGSAALFALMLPLVEVSYSKAAAGHVTYDLVMEMQFVLSLTATVFCLIGMAISKDFQAISREIKEYELGEGNYILVIIFSAVVWQFFYVGALGVIHFGSSLLSGIIIAACLPVTEILAVIFYKEKFQSEKAVSLLLSVWGFVSYFYGEIKNVRKRRRQQLLTEEPSSV